MRIFFALLLTVFSIKTPAGVEQATTFFHIRALSPTCHVQYPAVIELGTHDNNETNSNGSISGVANFTVGVICAVYNANPNIRFWDHSGSPYDMIGAKMSPVSGKGAVYAFLQKRGTCLFLSEKPGSSLWVSTPSGERCLSYFTLYGSDNYTEKIDVDLLFTPDAVGDFQGQIGIEVYYP